MKRSQHILSALALLLFFTSCQVEKRSIRRFSYDNFKAGIMPLPSGVNDSIDVFEANDFTVGNDSLQLLFRSMDSLWKIDRAELRNAKPADETEKKMLKAELAVVNKNIKSLSSFLKDKSSTVKDKSSTKKSVCREKECPVVAEVVKSKQLMYLYVAGDLKDSFAVSTGTRGRETPNMNVRPTGPVFMKYTSTKYPEGNYMGLGNMPYAVFVKGGYAIHGTTQGNFSKLGRKASHGCIRLHPDNAKLFYQLVNLVGLNNTWVIVR